MTDNKLDILIELADRPLRITIASDSESSMIIFKNDAIENGEAVNQIVEGGFYEYHLDNTDYYLAPCEIVSHSRFGRNSGRIVPNIYVGTLTIDILDSKSNEKCGALILEVQSKKTTYREDYRTMLSDITEKCVDLLLQPNSPVTNRFEPDFNVDARTIYQRFAFVKSLIESEEFTDAIHKVLSAPVTKWKETEIDRDIRGIRKIGISSIKQIASRTNRINLPENHSLFSQGILKSVPAKIQINHKRETVDTPENRFIKFALFSFQSFCSDILLRGINYSRLNAEAASLVNTLDQHLGHSIFKDISDLSMIPLNSPVLQRKEGYREILRAWLMFDLAAKLIWRGGEDVYDGGKRDVATLYEYWLFFKLLDVLKEVFKIEPKSIQDLISETKDGLSLQLKQGQDLSIEGIFQTESRKLQIQFSYNRTFSGKSNYPKGGSWTRDLRPDYTLTIWPYGIDQKQAEIEELIVHVHFDAKYRVENLNNFLNGEAGIENLNQEKIDQSKGTYKRADLLKMHAYRDAIRRTAGAYILYPGDKTQKAIGFHEILPGLGAFAINPSKQNEGTAELKIFLNEVVQHFLNRASQRERMTLKTYETYKDKPGEEVKEAIPEAYGKNRSLIPDEIYVLVAYYKDESHLNWIHLNRLYNARTGNDKGSLRLDPKISGAKYLLLHGRGELHTSKLYKLKSEGPRIFSKMDMIKLKYPNQKPRKYYLVFDVGLDTEEEFKRFIWDIRMLRKFRNGQRPGIPFAVSLSDLMKTKIEG